MRKVVKPERYESESKIDPDTGVWVDPLPCHNFVIDNHNFHIGFLECLNKAMYPWP